jgi:hypothetical protein
MSFCYHMASGVHRLLPFHILIFSCETNRPNNSNLARKVLVYIESDKSPVDSRWLSLLRIGINQLTFHCKYIIRCLLHIFWIFCHKVYTFGNFCWIHEYRNASYLNKNHSKIFSETTVPVWTKPDRNDPWVVYMPNYI